MPAPAVSAPGGRAIGHVMTLVGARSPAGLMHDLRPPRRTVFQRLFGSFGGLGNKRFEQARFAHARLNPAATPRLAGHRHSAPHAAGQASLNGHAPSAANEPLQTFAADVAMWLRGRDATAETLFASVHTRLTSDKFKAAEGLLAQCDAATIIDALQGAWIKQQQGLSPRMALAKAEVVYAALAARAVPDALERQDRQDKALARLDGLLKSVAALAVESPRSAWVALLDFEDGLKQEGGLDAAARTGLAERVQALKAQLRPGRSAIEAMFKDLRAGLTTTQDGVRKILLQLTRVRESVEISTVPGSKDRDDLQALADALQADGDTLLARDKELGEMVGKGYPQLASALRGLDAAAYLRAERDLDAVLASVPEADRRSILEVLNAKVTDPSQARWISDLRKGDPDIVHLVLAGPQWSDEAYALKLQGIEEAHQRELARINREFGIAGKDTTPHTQALRAEQDRHELALRGLDVEHELRSVAEALNRFMQSQKLAGRPGAKDLPVSAFTALKPDAAFIGWLMKNAGEQVAARDLCIANWISLALYDPKTGRVDQAQVEALFNQLGLAGLDVKGVKRQVRQGFGSLASVQACRAQVEQFVTALGKSEQAGQAVEKQSPRLRADRIARDLYTSLTGQPTDVAWSRKMDQQVAQVVADKLPWIRFQQDIALRRKQRSEMENGLCGPAPGPGAKPGKRDWLRSETALNGAAKAHEIVDEAFLYHDLLKQQAAALGDAPEVVAHKKGERTRLAQRLTECLGRLKGFDCASLRVVPGVKSSPSIADLLKVRDDLAMVKELRSNRRAVAALKPLATPAMADEAQGEAVVKTLVNLAMVQEAALAQGGDFTPRDHAGAILNRMKAMGISNRSGSTYASAVWQSAATALEANTASVAQLCDQVDPSLLANRLAAGLDRLPGAVLGLGRGGASSAPATTAAASGTAPAAPPVPQVSDAQKRRDANTDLLARMFKDMKPGQQATLRFGVYGEVSVTPFSILGVSVNSTTRADRSNSITVECAADGTYGIRLGRGHAVRQGFSVNALRNVMKISGFGERGNDAAHDFRFEQRDDCSKFLLGLANGDAVNPALWAAGTVRRDAASTARAGGAVNATLDLTVASLSAEVSAGRTVRSSTSHTAQGERETFSATYEARAEATASLAAGLGDKSAVAGRNLRVERALDKQFGMFTADSALTLATRVVGDKPGKAKASVAMLLPHLGAAQVAEYAERMGEVPDGTEVFVRARLDEGVRRQANAHLGRANALLMQASLAPAGERRDPLVTQARSAVQAAYALTESPESYVFEGLGWTRSDSAQVQAGPGGVVTRYADAGSQQTQFLPFTADTAMAGPSARVASITQRVLAGVGGKLP